MLKARNFIIIFCVNYVIMGIVSIFIEQMHFDEVARMANYTVQTSADMAIEMSQATDDFFTAEKPYGRESNMSYITEAVPVTTKGWTDVTSNFIMNSNFTAVRKDVALFNYNSVGQFVGASPYRGENDLDTPIIDNKWGKDIQVGTSSADLDYVVSETTSGYLRLETKPLLITNSVRDSVSHQLTPGAKYRMFIDINKHAGDVYLGYYNGVSFVEVAKITKDGDKQYFDFEYSGSEFKLELRVADVMQSDGNYLKSYVEYQNIIVTKVSLANWHATGDVMFHDYDWGTNGRTEYVEIPNGAWNSIENTSLFEIASIGETSSAIVELSNIGTSTFYISEYDSDTDKATRTLVDSIKSSSNWTDSESKYIPLRESTKFLNVKLDGANGHSYIDNFYVRICETQISNWSVSSKDKSRAVFRTANADETGLRLERDGKPAIQQKVYNMTQGDKYKITIDYTSNVPIEVEFAGVKRELKPRTSGKDSYTFEYTNSGETTLRFMLDGDSDNSWCNLRGVTLETETETQGTIMVKKPVMSATADKYDFSEGKYQPTVFNIKVDTGNSSFETVNFYRHFYNVPATIQEGTDAERAYLYDKTYTNNEKFKNWVNKTTKIRTLLYKDESTNIANEDESWKTIPTVAQLGLSTIGGTVPAGQVDSILISPYKLQTANKEGFFGTYYYTPLSVGLTYLDEDILSYMFNTNMDIIMRRKYDGTSKDGLYSGAGFVPNEILGYLAGGSNGQYAHGYEDYINNGLFAFKRGQIHQTKSGKKAYDGGGTVHIEYKLIDVFDPKNNDIIRVAFGGNHTADTIRNMVVSNKDATNRIQPNGKGLSSLYTLVAKIDFEAELVIPYSTYFTRYWKYRYDADGNLRNPIAGDERVDNFNFDRGSNIFHYTTYFSVLP